jgi:hypothetical protein
MLGIVIAALITLVLNLGLTVSFGQSEAPYSTCIKSTDHGYNIILQQDNDCSSKQLSETVLYYEANGYNEVGQSKVTGLKTVHLSR